MMSYCRYSKNNGDVMEVIPLDSVTGKFWKYNKNVSERKRLYYKRFFFKKDLEVKTGSEVE